MGCGGTSDSPPGKESAGAVLRCVGTQHLKYFAHNYLVYAVLGAIIMVQNVWKDVSPGEEVPEIVNVFIEIPKGCRNKYEYHKDYGVIKLDRVLYSPFHYPYDYGFIPRTYCEDGDPLDAFVIMDEATYPGTLIEGRPIGMLEMIDGGEGMRRYSACLLKIRGT